MKGWAAFFAALFALAAAVQWNDPDPLLWILGYLAVSGLSVAAFLGRRLFVPNLLATLAFAIWFATLASSLVGAPEEAFTSFKMQAQTHEEPREALGLALCVAWCATLSAWSRRRISAEGTSSLD